MYAGGLMSPMQSTEVLQRSGLSTIGDILRHRRLSLFSHVARLDHGVPAHDALRLMMNTYEGRKASWRRSQRLARQNSGGYQHSTAIYAVEN